jgi:hypothetical protein
MKKKLIVTHHSPDLDAIGAAWLLKTFDEQTYAQAEFDFVNPGDRLSQEKLEQLKLSQAEVTHVDTGLGKFDHHQPEKAQANLCASSLVYQHLCQVYPILKEDQALKELVSFINEIDHFQEIHWPEPSHLRYTLMLHELIRGKELVTAGNDLEQMRFSCECLDCAYLIIKQTIQANQIIEEKGIQFSITAGACVGFETSNEETIKQAQKQGYTLVIRKDPQKGHVRIKLRPDAHFTLQKLHQLIIAKDQEGSWFYHSGGKMLLNGSLKHRNQVPSPLSLKEVIELIKQAYP